jgi:uncharacterized circularly permuted ATP-grasp superfamily protein/uncharacterized alpha-E superfamily protein
MSEFESRKQSLSGNDSFTGWLQQNAPDAMPGHWDELRNSLGKADSKKPTEFFMPSQIWQQFFKPLEHEHTNRLDACMASLQRQVNDNGITYNVYAHSEQPQRPWSLDLFPLLITASQWSQIEHGVQQRMRLLEAIMKDAYGEQQLVGQGKLPAALVQGHPGYFPNMHGCEPVGGCFLNLAAFDLARGPDGLWWLLSQRTQAPSGLGYLLENRLIISRLFPQAFESLMVQRLASTYKALVESIKSRCPCGPGETPHVALLTPGPYNETYFEHAYLARYLGLTLVQSADLTVRENGVFLKTIQGLQRVHGLIKRVDDQWVDPLELRADSTLGVAGLLQAIRKQLILVANAPGSGFLESNALLGFMPALAQHLLNEELVLPAIPSWWCGEQSVVADALENLRHSVIKPTYPSDGQRVGFEPVLGHTLQQNQLDEWAGRIIRDPEGHTVQSWLPLSQLPIWNKTNSNTGHLETRPVILRVFALANQDGSFQVLPGGLARLGSPQGLASMQHGGSSADVWVQAESAGHINHTSLINSSAPANMQQRVVTSRSAENLFWMGRYTERAENNIRLVRLSLDLLSGTGQLNQPLLKWLDDLIRQQGMVLPDTPLAQQSLRVFERSLVAGLWDSEHTTSLSFNLNCLLQAGAAVRDRLSAEHWQMLTEVEAGFKSARVSIQDGFSSHAQVQQGLLQASHGLAGITGAQIDRMMRDDGWRMLSIGRLIERLDFLSVAWINAQTLKILHEQTGFDALLHLFDSTISFHAQYQQSRTLAALTDLIITSTANPRSLAWIVQTLRGRLQKLSNLHSGATMAIAGLLPETTLADSVVDFPGRARAVSEALSAAFFSHSHQTNKSLGI